MLISLDLYEFRCTLLAKLFFMAEKMRLFSSKGHWQKKNDKNIISFFYFIFFLSCLLLLLRWVENLTHISVLLLSQFCVEKKLSSKICMQFYKPLQKHEGVNWYRMGKLKHSENKQRQNEYELKENRRTFIYNGGTWKWYKKCASLRFPFIPYTL